MNFNWAWRISWGDTDSSINWNIKGYNYLLNYSNLILRVHKVYSLDMDHGVFHIQYSNTTSKKCSSNTR
jgi:hypothetical protein